MYVDVNGSKEKGYVCLFTCAVSCAIHLEVVIDLTEETFLQAFRQFASRKSLPSKMISENASTYQRQQRTSSNSYFNHHH